MLLQLQLNKRQGGRKLWCITRIYCHSNILQWRVPINIKKNIKYLRKIFSLLLILSLNNIAHNNYNITHHCSAYTKPITKTIKPSN